MPNLPPLRRDAAFWGLTCTQFFGAFNDNVFKQLVLALAVTAGAVAGTGQTTESEDQQWIAMLVFAAAVLLFSGIAGFLSEKFTKRTVIVWSKVAEVFVMAMGMAAFYFTSTTLWPLFTVLFLMGMQTAFFGPSKYGILPEMLREKDLSQANGMFMTTTFLAIIFGTLLAGPLTDLFRSQLYFASAVCVMIAVVGALTSLLTRRTPVADPDLEFKASSALMSRDTAELMWSDRPLLLALLASCMFWLVGGVVQQAVNSFGLKQILVTAPTESLYTWNSVLAGGIGVGIAIGSIAAGLASGGHVNFRVMKTGCWGIVFFLTLLALPGPFHQTLLGYWGSLAALIGLGAFTGMFAVPLQVFLQTRPPAGQKGRTIAAMNQANWVAIVTSALVYKVFDELLVAFDWPRSALFALTAALMLPVAIFYRPVDAPPPPSAGGKMVRRRPNSQVAETSELSS